MDDKAPAYVVDSLSPPRSRAAPILLMELSCEYPLLKPVAANKQMKMISPEKLALLRIFFILILSQFLPIS